MPLTVADRVKDTTTTTGTGSVTLSGSAPTGYQTFSVIGDGNTTYYTIVGGSQWEVGIGTYTASGTSLSRDTVLASSTGSQINFSAGQKDVFVTYPASIATLANPVPVSGGGTGVTTVTGILAGNGTTAVSGRTITGTANEITVTNGSGASANPTLSLPTALTFTGKTVTGGALTSVTITVPAAPATTHVGFLGLPQNIQNTTYALTMADAGGSIYHTSATPHTISIPANSSVAFPIGTIMTIDAGSSSGTVSVTITTDTLRFLPSSSTGSRTITGPGTLTLKKVASTEWWCWGLNVA